jgi:hypothetical protein
MKTFHKFQLKDGTQVVLARSQFHPAFGYQVVAKGGEWNAVRMTLSNGDDAIGEVVDRKAIKSRFRASLKLCLKKLRDL